MEEREFIPPINEEEEEEENDSLLPVQENPWVDMVRKKNNYYYYYIFMGILCLELDRRALRPPRRVHPQPHGGRGDQMPLQAV